MSVAPNELLKLKKMVQSHHINFIYSGYITDSVLTGVGEAVKQKLSIDNNDTKTIRSVFAVFVEQMQNISRYSAEGVPQDGDDPELRFGVVAIGSDAAGFMVASGNLIMRHDVERVRRSLEVLRGSDREELKSLYKAKLRNGPDIGSKGASIGLIEIARRANQPLEFDFIDVDARRAFFVLKATI